MAVDMFLTVGDLKGEAQDDKHKEWIDVLAWSWGMSQSGTMHVGSGGGGGKVNVQDLSVTKWIDKSTPVLMGAIAAGNQYGEAKLIVRKAGGKEPVEYVVITMKDVIITSASTGGSGGEDRLTENVTLNFRQVHFDYQPQDKNGAKLGGQIKFGWNIAENKKV